MPRPPRPPGPRALGPGGALLPFARDPLGFLERLAREHGPVARFRLGPREVWSLADPELVREVLVVRHASFRKDRGLEAARILLGEGLLTSEGEVWRRHRRLAQPAFHADRVAVAAEVMGRRAVARAEGWRDGARLDASREAMALALEIVGEALFGGEVGGDIETIGAALDIAVDQFRMGRLPFARLLQRLPVPSTLRLRRVRRTLDAIVLRLVAERRARPGGSDLLAMLVEATDPEGGAGLTDAELRDEAMTLFLAGHETTANALAWSIDLLGRHPDVERRVHAEVDAAIGDRIPGAADVPRLPLVRRVVAEAMRLFPPAWTLARRAVEPVPLGGFVLPAGASVLMSPWVMHRQPSLWPEPERFDPDRFLPERRAGAPRLSYFPFGAGPRICIGEAFAWSEAVLVLAAVTRRWRLVPVNAAPPVPVPRITLRPGGGVPVVLKRRRAAQADAGASLEPARA